VTCTAVTAETGTARHSLLSHTDAVNWSHYTSHVCPASRVMSFVPHRVQSTIRLWHLPMSQQPAYINVPYCGRPRVSHKPWGPSWQSFRSHPNWDRIKPCFPAAHSSRIVVGAAAADTTGCRSIIPPRLLIPQGCIVAL
jgi:hypothetical protein